jgi:hypothetical protein
MRGLCSRCLYRYLGRRYPRLLFRANKLEFKLILNELGQWGRDLKMVQCRLRPIFFNQEYIRNVWTGSSHSFYWKIVTCLLALRVAIDKLCQLLRRTPRNW